MKALFTSLMILSLLLCATANATAFESRGSAIATGIQSHYAGSTNFGFSEIWVTNISGVEVTCRVTPYDHAGDDMTAYLRLMSGSSSSHTMPVLSTGTGTFTLPAGETRVLQVRMLQTGRHIAGYAVIEWSADATQNPPVRKALVAMVKDLAELRGRAKTGYPVNGGQPF